MQEIKILPRRLCMWPTETGPLYRYAGNSRTKALALCILVLILVIFAWFFSEQRKGPRNQQWPRTSRHRNSNNLAGDFTVVNGNSFSISSKKEFNTIYSFGLGFTFEFQENQPTETILEKDCSLHSQFVVLPVADNANKKCNFLMDICFLLLLFFCCSVNSTHPTNGGGVEKVFFFCFAVLLQRIHRQIKIDRPRCIPSTYAQTKTTYIHSKQWIKRNEKKTIQTLNTKLC